MKINWLVLFSTKMDLRESINIHVKGYDVFLVQRDRLYCEIVNGLRGKTIQLESMDDLQQILENLHTYVLDEEINIEYFIDRNVDLHHEFPTIAFDICCICYSTTKRETSCSHLVCLVCAPKISNCPICRRTF